MRVLLLNPPRYQGIPVVREDRCEITDRTSVIPPYSLIQLAAILRERENDVILIDANGEDIDYEEIKRRLLQLDAIEAVVLRFTPTTADHDLDATKLIKEIDARITTIGLCWTLQTCARDILESYDSLDIYALGDYEVTVPSLIDALTRRGPEAFETVRNLAYKIDGEVICTEVLDEDIDYDDLPMAAFDLIDMNHYYNNTKRNTRYMIMFTSKGCPFNCIYCTMRRTKWKFKSAENVVGEIFHLVRDYGTQEVSFFDETFTLDRGRVVNICEGLLNKDINITWYCNTRVDKVDQELLKLMRKAGCRGVSFGVESGSQVILRNAKKGDTVEQARNAIKWAKDAGIKTYTSFMVGLPGESWNTIQETIDFIKDTLPNGAQFNVAVPYPGTELHEMAKTNGWLDENLDWRTLYQHDSVLRTAEMFANELDLAREILYQSLYFNPRWLLGNLKFLVRNPEDIPVAARYYSESLWNYLFHGMRHAH